MEWMIDTANLQQIDEALDTFPVSGITTNPTILRAELPIDYAAHLRAIRALAGSRTFHVQVKEAGCAAIMEEAARIRGIVDDDVYLKVPVTEEGLRAIRLLRQQGIHVTATAIYYPIQAMLAAEAGAEYLAPYCNRMEQNEIDYARVIDQVRNLLDRDGYPAKILAASFKNAGQVVKAIDSGAHAVTVQPSLLHAALRSSLVTDAVRAFNADQDMVLGN